MDVSVIVRSKDEADRLRLTLAALAAQVEAVEVVVVNDGSSDHTGEVLSAAAAGLRLERIDNPRAIGRSAASNAGASLASGEILLFLDGDVLPAPDLVARHRQTHEARPGLIARGETWHLRQTRFFQDPQAGAPMPGEEARVAGMSDSELRKSTVTIEAIVEDFTSIDRRAQPAIYPGAGPRRLYDIEIDALRSHPECTTLWAAASGHNFSVTRDAFLAAGGFDPDLTINEHRELALRLCGRGLRMALIDGARSYHMTHRRGWRDPLLDTDWLARFHAVHPVAEVALLPVLWASLSDSPPFPDEARITSLPQLAAAAARLPRGLSPAAAVEAHLAAVGVRETLGA